MSNKIFGLGRIYIYLREAITQNKGNICVLTLRQQWHVVWSQVKYFENVCQKFGFTQSITCHTLEPNSNASGSRFPPFPKNPPLSNHYENLSHMCLPIKAKCYEWNSNIISYYFFFLWLFTFASSNIFRTKFIDCTRQGTHTFTCLLNHQLCLWALTFSALEIKGTEREIEILRNIFSDVGLEMAHEENHFFIY